VLPLATNGLVGLVIGLWWSRRPKARRLLAPRVAAAVFAGLLVLLVSLAPTPLVQMTVGTVLRFCAILAPAITVGTGARRPLVRGISQLGRYSLSVFILHRPVIQAIQFVISRVELPSSIRYACLYPLTLGCMLLMCAARDRDDRVDRMLRPFL
jgi:peptidoglycan/LPS O-acetylase OafA/YrhL